MFILKQKIKKDIRNKVGLTVDEISSMSSEQINKHIEKRLRKKIPMAYPDYRIEARGSVYISLKRFLSRAKRDQKLANI